MRRETLLQNWHRYVQAPEQLAHSRIRTFPHHAVDRLAGVLGLDPGNRVLEVGSGVGILARRLAGWLDEPDRMVAVEPNRTLREAPLPDSLVGSVTPRVHPASGDSLPFEGDSFDVVVSHTLLNVLPGEMRGDVLSEMLRVVRPGGRIVGMDGVAGASYWPGWIRGEAGNGEVLREFNELHRETHRAVGTGLYNTFQSMPAWFGERGLTEVETRGWFQPCRLADGAWSEQQRIDLLDLEHRAGRQRIETLRNLLQDADRWEPEHAELMRRTSMYYQRREHRRRKAFEGNRDSGWSGRATLVVSGRGTEPG